MIPSIGSRCFVLLGCSAPFCADGRAPVNNQSTMVDVYGCNSPA